LWTISHADTLSGYAHSNKPAEPLRAMTELQFSLNGSPRRVADQPAHRMTLDWLRAQGLRATKEGCAEGDCGACTVLVDRGASRADGSPDWRAVCACILPLGQLDGCRVVTAEGLSDGDAGPHPAQRAMADQFATQCGYCSPGFVMSLAAIATTPVREDERLMDALAGNLCRCTGYRPIMDAARSLPVSAPRPQDPTKDDRLSDRRRATLDYTAPDGSRFVAPTTLDDLARLRAELPTAWLWAGGTDLGLKVTKDGARPNAILSLDRLDALHEIRDTADGGLQIGAAASYADMLDRLARIAPDLDGYFRRLGGAQIRNIGSVGGNLGTASPIGDSLPALISLDAVVKLVGPKGRRTVPADQFVIGYRETVMAADELIAAVHVPGPSPGSRFAGYKIAKRVDQDISGVSGCFRLVVGRDGCVQEVRAAFGGVAPRPLRAAATEAFLTGKPWSRETARAASGAVLEDISPISDARGTADYRKAVAGNLVERLWHDTAGAGVTRLEAL
jgi:xanthine dehydrogenase small subunit